MTLGTTCLLLFLMAYQVTERAAHEWLGMGMTTLVILHQVLKRKWYAALFRGKYGAIRILQTCVNVLLLSAFAASAVSGMALSEYAVPLLRGALPPVTARVTHLAASYWYFLLMGLHLGFHWGAITAKLRLSGKIRVCAALAAGYELFLFLRNGVPGYLTFRTHFTYLDYETPTPLILLENALMLLFWTWLAFEIAGTLRARGPRRLAYVSAVLLIGAALFILGGGSVNDSGAWEADGNAWEINGGDDELSGLKDISEREAEAETAEASGSVRFAEVGDGFALIAGGTFVIGSSETENWRVSDETPHEVRVSEFYLSPYEVTQSEYETFTGVNPSAFAGENLPVENVSWLDAARYCNGVSQEMGRWRIGRVGKSLK